MSDQSGIGSQKMKRVSLALKLLLLAGGILSMSCRASTNEDLSVPPRPDMAEPMRISPPPPQKTDLTAKPQQAQPVAAKPENASQKPSAPQVLGTPAAKASAGKPVKAPVVDAVPALPGAKAEPALQKGEAEADEAAKISAARESVKIIESRAQQRMRDVEWMREEMEITSPFPPKTKLEAIFLQADESVGKPDEEVFAPSGIFTGKSSVSVSVNVNDSDLQELGAQQQGRDGRRPYEKTEEKGGDASLGDASHPYDIDMRLPPMD